MEYIISIEISTNLFRNELIFKNYANFMDKNAEIKMLAVFKPIVASNDKNFTLMYHLFDPKGNFLRSNLNQRCLFYIIISNNLDQIYHSARLDDDITVMHSKDLHYFKVINLREIFTQTDKLPVVSGLWTLKVCLINDNDNNEENNVYNKENEFYMKHFLIFPSENEALESYKTKFNQPIDEMNSFLFEEFQKFWRFDSICIKNTNQSDISCDNTGWSTFYPDPKSNLTDIYID
jgi:hypothetical protein